MTADQQPSPATIIVSADQVNILLAALYIAAGYLHDRAALSTDCPDQSCATCQWRLQPADVYDQVAAEALRAAQTSATQCATSHADPVGGGQARGRRPGGRTVTWPRTTPAPRPVSRARQAMP